MESGSATRPCATHQEDTVRDPIGPSALCTGVTGQGTRSNSSHHPVRRPSDSSRADGRVLGFGPPVPRGTAGQPNGPTGGRTMSRVARRSRVAIDSESFYRYVNSTDQLTLVVRGHLSLEAVLNHLLDRALPRGLTEELDSLRFPQRVDLAIALGKLDIESRPAWMKINAIRNRFAHDLDAKITNEEARETLAMLPAWWAPPPVGTLDHPLGPASAIGWCMAVLWSRAINTGLSGHAPELPVVVDVEIVPGAPS